VIVNTANVEKGIGPLFKAIIAKAGPKIEDDFFLANRNLWVFFTSGYKMSLGVCHAYIPEYYKGKIYDEEFD
jgi:hypothetical protein